MSDESTLFENAWVPTGYMGEEIEIKPEFKIDSLQTLEWYVHKILAIKHDMNTIKQNADNILNGLMKQVENLEYLYKHQVIAEAQRHIPEGKKSVKTLWGTLQFRKVNAGINIENKEEVPREYYVEKIVYEIDKEKLKTACLTDGVVVPGVSVKAERDELYIS